MQRPSSTQAPMTPTAGRARPKSASQVRVRPPRPTAASTWLTRPFFESSQVHMMPAATSGMTCGQEEDGSGGRTERAGRDASDERRDEEAEHDGDAAEEDDELEGVEDDADEVGVGEDLDVVVEADERRLADAVPAQGRVQHGQGERQQDERGVDDEGRQDEEPARPANAADPAPGRGPQWVANRRAGPLVR